jgi:high-affinity iron transporter
VLNTFLIAIREGLEASLIVGILLAYVAKTGRRQTLPSIWAGVALAVGLSLGFGAFLTFTSHELSTTGEELFAGVTSVSAVALVTWMVFWMKKTARNIGKELHSKMDAAVALGTFGLISTAFLSVAREGLETSLFLYASFKTVGSNSAPAIGLVAGLAFSITLGVLIYRKSLRINLGKFFTFSGIALIIVASSVLHKGLLDLQSFGMVPSGLLLNWVLVVAYLLLALKPFAREILPFSVTR